VNPILIGGGQEKGMRSGSENIPGIVGFAKAAEITKREMEMEAKRLKVMRDKLIKNVLETIPKSHLNGHPVKRLPLISMGLLHEEAHGSLLISLGRTTRESDIDKLIEILPGVVRRLRELSPLTPPELLK
jgi:cysteine desulfurase